MRTTIPKLPRGSYFRRGSAFHQTAAALEQLRGIVGHAPAFLVEVATLIHQVAGTVSECFAPFPRLLLDDSASISARLRCVEQSDARSDCRPRYKPQQFSSIILRHILDSTPWP